MAQRDEERINEPLLVFTARISRCAGGYHIKIRPKDVKRLNLDGKSVKIKLYELEPPTVVVEEEPHVGEVDTEIERVIQETRKLKELESLLPD